MKRLVLIAIATAGLVACGGKKKDEGATGSGGSAGSAMMAGSGSAAAGSGSAGSAAAGSGSAAAGSGSSAKADVPTEQDFEAQANSTIDDKNVEAKVGQIEKELGQ